MEKARVLCVVEREASERGEEEKIYIGERTTREPGYTNDEKRQARATVGFRTKLQPVDVQPGGSDNEVTRTTAIVWR